ncbi:SRPBCC family protein [Solimonas soli]|uniref:SRPBCC family protein n=1 Tax=Solimonas soli TaxID=413479 RepID=UPI0004880551|nr:SRPBCC family protein [Solimonas soli]
MASFEIAARFDAPAEKVWGFVSWDGMPVLTKGGFFTRAEFPAGPQIAPGALRRVHLPEGPPFVERLEEIVPKDFYYRYRLVDTGALPITDYTGIVRVTPAGSGCCLKFGHCCTLLEGDAASWFQAWSAIEQQVFDFIRRSL